MTTSRHQPHPPGTLPLWGRVVIAAAVVLTTLLVLVVAAGTFFPEAARGLVGSPGAAPETAAAVPA